MRNTSYTNSSLLFKIFFWLTLIAFGFVLFNLTMMLLGFYPKTWVKEIYLTLQNGIPFFLFLTGTFIRNKKLRIPMILCFSTFFIGYVLNSLNFWELIDMNGVKWLIGPGLLGLFILYIIHFFQKGNKNVLDILKLLWLLCISYSFLSVRFPIGFKAMYFFYASIMIFPFLMGIGLYKYFKKTE